jgi:hypothetical protein
LKTNPSGAELLAETELETSRGIIDMSDDEDEEGFAGARFDVTDEEEDEEGYDVTDEDRLGFDDMTKTKPSGAEEACCDVDDEDKLGFDDMTNTKPSGAELLVETDDEEGPANDSEGRMDRMDEECADDDDDEEEEL